jgi:hypothetical protein
MLRLHASPQINDPQNTCSRLRSAVPRGPVSPLAELECVVQQLAHNLREILLQDEALPPCKSILKSPSRPNRRAASRATRSTVGPNSNTDARFERHTLSQLELHEDQKSSRSPGATAAPIPESTPPSRTPPPARPPDRSPESRKNPGSRSMASASSCGRARLMLARKSASFRSACSCTVLCFFSRASLPPPTAGS